MRRRRRAEELDAKRKQEKEEAEQQEVRQLLRDLNAQDVSLKSIRLAVKDLSRKPLGEGHTYSALPNGTNVVIMADGNIQLALPVRVADIGITPLAVSAVAVTTYKFPLHDS